MNVLSKIIPLLMSVVIMSGCDSEIAIQKPSAALDAIPAFSGEPYVVINDNQPDFDLNMMQPGQTLAQITSRALNGLQQIIAEQRPDLVLVHGDTTTTLAGALAAALTA